MIYFIVTTSLIEYNFDKRKIQYKNCINKLKQLTKNIPNHKIIIIENNGKRPTFLDEFNLEVFYTNNNTLNTNNKGIKELQDILDCIENYNIKRKDFIVKITGRYLLDNDSQFINIIKSMDRKKTYCVIKYGSYQNPSDIPVQDCISGLIGMKVKYLLKIELSEDECVEWCWARCSQKIPQENIIAVQGILGIHICPNRNKYFLV